MTRRPHPLSELGMLFDHTEPSLSIKMKKKVRLCLLRCGCGGYLAWFKLPVVDDACWDDGRVVPVTCVAVVLAHVVTLSGFTWHTPYQINLSVRSSVDKSFTHTSDYDLLRLLVCIIYILTQ